MSFRTDATSIEVVEGKLTEQPVAALMLSANSGLRAGSGWSKRVEELAGPGYVGECADLAARPGGLPVGGAVVMGGRRLAAEGQRRWVLQAITIRYQRDGSRVPATPAVVYAAARAALDLAELYRIESVATYLMAQRDGYRTASADEIADALCRALTDHAGIAVSVRRLVICQETTAEAIRADAALQRARQQRAT